MEGLETSSFFKRWEILLDLSSFSGVEFFSLIARKVNILHPHAVGALTATTSHALSIAASKRILNATSTDLQIVATVVGLAISTIGLPYALRKCTIHTVLCLNFETALRTAMTSLVVKATLYGLYRFGIRIFDYYWWQFPKTLKDLNSLPSSQQTHIKAFFTDHSDQRTELTLFLQYALSLPLGKCSGIGDGWSKESLLAIWDKTLDFLTTEQQKELNQLFMEHNLPPQERDYQRDELPELPESLQELSFQKLKWVHLISHFSDASVPPLLAEQFFKHDLEPAKDEWIELACPMQLECLKSSKLKWLQNYYQAHPEQWKELDLETQRSLKQKCSLRYLIYPKTVVEIKQLSKQELSAYAAAFTSNDTLKTKFSLEMRRVFANCIEEKLGYEVDALFINGEKRTAPNYLFGRVTTKQVLAVGLLVMVVVIPAFAGLGALFYRTSLTSPSQSRPSKEQNSQTIDLFPLMSQNMTLSKVNNCLETTCLALPSGRSQGVDYPIPSARPIASTEIQGVDYTYPVSSSNTTQISGTGKVSIFLQDKRISKSNVTLPLIQKDRCLATERFELVKIPSVCWEKDRPHESQFKDLETSSEVAPLIEEVKALHVSYRALAVAAVTSVLGVLGLVKRRRQVSPLTSFAPVAQENGIGGESPFLSSDSLPQENEIEQVLPLASSDTVSHEKGSDKMLREVEIKEGPIYDESLSPISQKNGTEGEPPFLSSDSLPQEDEIEQTPLWHDQLNASLMIREEPGLKPSVPASTRDDFQRLDVVNHPQAINEELFKSWEMMAEPSEVTSSRALKESPYAAWSHFIGENGHPAKMRKYRVVLDEYLRIMEQQFGVRPIDFLWKLQALVRKDAKNMLYQELYRAIEAMLHPIDPRRVYRDASTQRYTCIQSLRRAIMSDEYQEFQLKPDEILTPEQIFCRQAIWKLSETLFRPEIYTYLKEVTELFVQTSRSERKVKLDEETITAANFVGKIHEKNNDIKRAPKDKVGKSELALQYQKVCGALGCEDFIGTKNIPHLRNQFIWQNTLTKEKWVIDYFRHGCPIIPGKIWRIGAGMLTRPLAWFSGYNLAVKSGEAIAPEYEQMLRAKAARREGDLYVNHQKRIPGGTENERDRVEAIEGLQERHDNEFVLTQSVEGSLFLRKGKYAHITTFDDLINAFVETFNEQDNEPSFYAQNRLPQIFWDSPIYREAYLPKLKKLLKLLHKHFFDEREHIHFNGVNSVNTDEAYPLREWQVFIELGYSFMRKDLIFRLSNLETKSGKYKVTSMKDICKDKLDRGGNEAKNEDETNYYMMGDLKDVWFEETLYQLLGPPIVVKKKEAIPRRLEPGLALSEFLRTLPVEKREAIARFSFGSWKIHSVQVGKQQGQEAYPSKETARTKEEYQAYLTLKKEISDPVELEERLRRRFQSASLAEAKSTSEVKNFLRMLQPHIYFEEAEDVVTSNLAPYVNEKQEINEEAMFDQINRDLKRHHEGMCCMTLDGISLDGTPGKDASYLFETLSKFNISRQKVLGWMSLLQQGIFGKIEERMWKDLKITGYESGFQLRGHGEYLTERQKVTKKAIREYCIVMNDNQPMIQASSYYELIASDSEKREIFREKPYAVLRAEVTVDFASNQSWSIWAVDETVKN